MAKVTRPAEKEVSPIPPPVAPEEPPSTVENIISIILGLAVVLVIGAMIINTIRNRQTQTPPPVASTTTQEKGTTGETSYTVQPGDTLWSIAVKFYNDGYKWPEIQKANNLKSSDALEKGKQLTIPKIEGASPVAIATTPTPEPTTTPQPTEATGPTGPSGGTETKVGQTLSTSTDKEYTVVKGDTLWDISVRHYGTGYRWVDIARANKLTNPNLIHPGNVFTLP